MEPNAVASLRAEVPLPPTLAQVCDHQRLCGQGYCFSASLPPYLAAAAAESLRLLGEAAAAQAAGALRSAAAALRRDLGTPGAVVGLELVGREGRHSDSPLLHLRLAGSGGAGGGEPAAAAAAAAKLQRVSDRLLQEHGVLVALVRYSCLDRCPPPPSLKLLLHAQLGAADVARLASAIKEAATHALA